LTKKEKENKKTNSHWGEEEARSQGTGHSETKKVGSLGFLGFLWKFLKE